MGVMDAVGSSLMNNMGNVEKAILEVIDLRGREAVQQDAVAIVKGGGLGGMAGNALGGGALMNKGTLMDYVGTLAGLKEGTQLTAAYLKQFESRRKLFTVQFNPNSLTLSGHNGGLVRKMNSIEGSKDDVSQAYAKATISMSVDLLFDAMDPQDAFMEAKTNLAPTNVAKGIANALLTGNNKKKTSVQRDVEGLIGALRNENTRLITFHWGSVSYSGVLRGVSAEYTMFNPVGEPVRAVVNLNIMCADAEIWPNSLAVWQQRYKEDFKDGSESFVSTGQKFGNLINL